MAIKAVIGSLIGLFGLGILAGIALAFTNTARGRKSRPGVIIAVICLLGVMILSPLNAGLQLVQPNEVGVVFRQTASGNDALRDPLQAGLSWVLPFIDEVIVYDVGQQSVTMSGGTEATSGAGGGVYPAVSAISSDGQIIKVDVTIIYRIDRDQINDIHRNWPRTGNFDRLQDGFVVPQARSEVRNALSEFGAEALYSGGRTTLETQLNESLIAIFEEEGILLTDILIREIVFSPEFANAIERKQIAEQEAQQAGFRVQQSEQEANQARAEAQGLADSVVIQAEGEAKAIVLKAEAKSQALRLVNEILSLNPNLLQYEYINQLGDNIELILIPSNSPFLFDFDALTSGGNGNSDVPTPTSTPPPADESDSGDEGDDG